MDLKRNFYLNGEKIASQDIVDYYFINIADKLQINDIKDGDVTVYENMRVVDIEKYIVTGNITHDVTIENVYLERP
jgi:hypothetical protein